MRDIPAALLTALAGDYAPVVLLVELDFPGGFVRAHHWIGPLAMTDPADGSTLTFEGVGDLGTITGIEQPDELRAVELTASLTGIDPALVVDVLVGPIQGRGFRVFMGALDGTESALVGGAGILLASGSIDNAEITIGATARIDVRLRNHLADWDRPRIVRYSGEAQRALYPGDTFCDRVAIDASREIVWGR